MEGTHKQMPSISKPNSADACLPLYHRPIRNKVRVSSRVPYVWGNEIFTAPIYCSFRQLSMILLLFLLFAHYANDFVYLSSLLHGILVFGGFTWYWRFCTLVWLSLWATFDFLETFVSYIDFSYHSSDIDGNQIVVTDYRNRLFGVVLFNYGCYLNAQ